MPVVILTYMRSGSSFFGEVLQASDDVFYLFEPLRTIQFHFRKSNTFYYLNGNNRSYTNFLDIAADVLNEIFQCNFENLPLPFFADGFLSKGKKSKEFRVCMHQKTKNTSLNEATKQCALMMKKMCQASKYIILKTIRIPLKILVPFPEIFPKFKILHLLRDPRATLKSQSRFGVVRTEYMQENATKFCNRVYNDITIARQTTSIADGRYFPISYENLAKYPFEMATNVYNFLEMEVNADMTSRVEKLTMAKKTCGESKIAKTMCTKSSNSSADADKWRGTIPFHFVSVVDNACQMLYSIVGLQSIPDEVHLRNLSFSLRRETIPDFGDFRFS
nr:carbohydrate sulfotransferase 1 [Crassostrea gigas]